MKNKGKGKPFPLIQQGGHYIGGAALDDRLNPLAWVNASRVTDTEGEVVTLETEVDLAGIVGLSGNEIPPGAYEKIEQQNRRAIKSQVTLLRFGASTSYQADGTGHLSSAVVTEDALRSLHAWDGEARTRSPVDLETMAVHGAGVEPGRVGVSLNRFDGKVSPVPPMAAAAGELGLEILRDESYDFTGGNIRHPGTGNLVGLGYHRTLPTFVWYDQGYQAVHTILKTSLPRPVVQIVSVDDAAHVYVSAV